MDSGAANVAFVMNWPFGIAQAVAVDSVRNLAFCGSGGGVYVLDLHVVPDPAPLSDAIRTRG